MSPLLSLFLWACNGTEVTASNTDASVTTVGTETAPTQTTSTTTAPASNFTSSVSAQYALCDITEGTRSGRSKVTCY